MRHSATPPRQRARRFVRTRALLAGALVLGIGSSLTLASWTDNEFAGASFASSIFVIESNASVTPSWAVHDAGNSAMLGFAAIAMSPGVSHYAFMDIRTTAATTVPGTAALSAISLASGALLPALEYRVIMTTVGVTCTSAFVGSPLAYISVTGVGAPVPSASGTLVLGAPAPAAGVPLRFCFDVRVKIGSASTFQGTVANVTWQFTGTSNP